ncbi:MAG TPA: DinB family protein [Longimicrobiaceae bacterium]|jgi:hypothetical protein|nr:DinB family protein [Longimicrobiaceae bacterium]
MHGEKTLRETLAKALGWGEAHADYDKAVAGLAADKRGVRPDGVPHSPWEIVEHIRLTQRDILEFCRDASYRERDWPADYWPPTPAPPSDDAWDESIRAFQADREAMKQLAADPEIDLFAAIPHGSGQTYLRELILVTDHTAYHVGQLVTVRQALGAWEG